MKLISKSGSASFKKDDTAAFFITEEDSRIISKILPEGFSYLYDSIDLSHFKGKSSEILFIPFKDKPDVILSGLGKKKDIASESLRNSSANITYLCREKSKSEVILVLPDFENFTSEQSLKYISEGAVLANYSFNKYITKKNDDDSPKDMLLKSIFFYTSARNSQKILDETLVICSNTLLCRDLINETSDKCDSVMIASEAKKLKLKGLTCSILGKKDLEKLNMGLILAVNKGSKIPPALVVMKYVGDPKNKKFTAFVGKGLTFDSGGMNLKPSGHMETMRMDMSGAAAILFAVKSIAELKLNVNVYGVMPLTENMLSNDSYRPGDIFKSYSGKTVEIGNTDAEGRLILADALAYTEKVLKPNFIIDLATLTGAVITTLGETVAAYLSTNEDLSEYIRISSEETGDKSWRLPFYPDFDDRMKSDIADISNVSSEKNAGTITGAVFLKSFITSTPWAHIDIAGTAWYSKKRGYRPKNATGYGVRLLTEIIRKI